jgi:hypothetical protein
VEFRSESSRDLAVFRRFLSFSAYLRYAIEWAVECAQRLEKLPEAFEL